MVVSDTWNMTMIYHCFSDVGIWASLGKHENGKCRFPKLCEIVMCAEHENGKQHFPKSC